MKRYYLTEIIGDGNPDNGNDFRSPLSDYPVTMQCDMPWDDARNVPLNAWVLAEVKAGDLSLFADDTRIMPLPDVPLETTYYMMAQNQRDALNAELGRWGILVTPIFSDTFGAILAAIRIRANAGNNKPAAAQLTL